MPVPNPGPPPERPPFRKYFDSDEAYLKAWNEFSESKKETWRDWNRRNQDWQDDQLGMGASLEDVLGPPSHENKSDYYRMASWADQGRFGMGWRFDWGAGVKYDMSTSDRTGGPTSYGMPQPITADDYRTKAAAPGGGAQGYARARASQGQAIPNAWARSGTSELKPNPRGDGYTVTRNGRIFYYDRYAQQVDRPGGRRVGSSFVNGDQPIMDYSRPYSAGPRPTDLAGAQGGGAPPTTSRTSGKGVSRFSTEVTTSGGPYDRPPKGGGPPPTPPPTTPPVTPPVVPPITPPTTPADPDKLKDRFDRAGITINNLDDPSSEIDPRLIELMMAMGQYDLLGQGNQLRRSLEGEGEANPIFQYLKDMAGGALGVDFTSGEAPPLGVETSGSDPKQLPPGGGEWDLGLPGNDGWMKQLPHGEEWYNRGKPEDEWTDLPPNDWPTEPPTDYTPPDYTPPTPPDGGGGERPGPGGRPKALASFMTPDTPPPTGKPVSALGRPPGPPPSGYTTIWSDTLGRYLTFAEAKARAIEMARSGGVVGDTRGGGGSSKEGVEPIVSTPPQPGSGSYTLTGRSGLDPRNIQSVAQYAPELEDAASSWNKIYGSGSALMRGGEGEKFRTAAALGMGSSLGDIWQRRGVEARDYLSNYAQSKYFQQPMQASGAAQQAYSSQQAANTALAGIRSNERLQQSQMDQQNKQFKQQQSSSDWATYAALAGSLAMMLSDKKTKQKIRPFKKGLAAILALKPVKFEYNGKAFTMKGDKKVGFIADDVEKVLPEAIKKETFHDLPEMKRPKLKASTYRMLDTNAILTTLVGAVQELDSRVPKMKGGK